MLHPFKVATMELDASLASANPVKKTQSPLLLGDVADLSSDGKFQEVDVTELTTSQVFFKEGEEEEITW